MRASTQTRAQRPRRARLRRLGQWCVGGLVLVTVASLVFNVLSRPPATLTPPDGEEVMVGDTRVHYRTWETAGTPVVLVHGFMESTVSWAATAEELARTHRVLALDLAGSGYTQYTGHYTLDDEVALVAGFITALQVGRPVLVGHSLGAAVVGGVALKHPDLVSGVIFADGDGLPFNGERGRQRGAWLMRLPYLTSLYRLAVASPSLTSWAIRSQCGEPCHALTPELVHAWIRPLRQGDFEDALRIMAPQGVLHLTPEQLQAITVPRGIIWGAEDSTSGGSLAATRRNLHDPPAVIIADAAHLSMTADPQRFAEAVNQLTATMR